MNYNVIYFCHVFGKIVNSDEIWYVVSLLNLQQNEVNIYCLTWVVLSRYHEKFVIHFDVTDSNEILA
jgi:hypothetical protein